MKPTTKHRIEIIILALLAIAGFIWACTLEAAYEREMERKESDTYQIVYMDGARILIPID